MTTATIAPATTSATQPRHTTTSRRPSVRVSPFLLAAVVSTVAALAALVLHGVAGVAEMPLVVGTILVASLAGWFNTSGSLRTRPIRG